MFAGAAAQTAQTSNTEHFEFPADGVLRIERSLGELRVQGWDRPDAEITTIKPADSELRVTAGRRDNELVVTTFPHRRPFPFWARSSDVKYEIKLPRTARLIVKHESGDVHLDEIMGDIQVSDGQGEITVLLPENGQYDIKAKCNLGAVMSDFPGREQRRWLAGHEFSGKEGNSPQKLYLRAGYGDIIVLKARTAGSPVAAP